MEYYRVETDIEKELVDRAKELEIDISNVCAEALWSVVYGRHSLELELMELQAEERIITREVKVRELRLTQLESQIIEKGKELKEYKTAKTIQRLLQKLNQIITQYNFIPVDAWPECENLLELLGDAGHGFTKEQFFNHCIILKQYQDIKK